MCALVGKATKNETQLFGGGGVDTTVHFPASVGVFMGRRWKHLYPGKNLASLWPVSAQCDKHEKTESISDWTSRRKDSSLPLPAVKRTRSTQRVSPSRTEMNMPFRCAHGLCEQQRIFMAKEKQERGKKKGQTEEQAGPGMGLGSAEGRRGEARGFVPIKALRGLKAQATRNPT